MYHKDLEAWKQAINLVTKIYKITKEFPKDELFGLTSQMQRAAVSIPSNIAEGCARAGDADTLRFIDMSIGSIAELETQLIISKNLGYLHSDEIFDELDKTSAMMGGLKKYLKNKVSSRD